MKIAIMFLLVIGTILSLQLATIEAIAIGTSTKRHQTEFLSGDLRCETTTGSPHIHHIQSAYARINARVGEMCRQDNIGGSECTTIWWEGDAGITICGEHNGAISCPNVAYAARQIYDNCVWGERFAGGWFQFHDRAENWVVVFFKDK